MPQFSDRNRREWSVASGVDVEEAYRLLQLEIRMGGPVCQRLLMALQGLDYVNNDHREGRNITDHWGSMTDNHPAAKLTAVTKLTPAEIRALSAIIDYGVVRSAARMIGLSHHTMRDQLKTARRKLGAKNTTHAVAIAIRQGMIGAPLPAGERLAHRTAYRLLVGDIPDDMDHCKRGHKYTLEDTFQSNGKPRRNCRICKSIMRRRRYLQHKGLAT